MKSLVRQASNIPEDLQRIVFQGIELEDEETLSFYGISSQCTLGLIVSDLSKVNFKIILFSHPKGSSKRTTRVKQRAIRN